MSRPANVVVAVVCFSAGLAARWVVDRAAAAASSGVEPLRVTVVTGSADFADRLDAATAAASVDARLANVTLELDAARAAAAARDVALQAVRSALEAARADAAARSPCRRRLQHCAHLRQ